MKLAVALSAAAVVATALVGPPVAAAPAPAAPAALAKKSFTVCLKFTTRLEVPYGHAQGMGNFVVLQGVLTDTSGRRVGTLTSVNRVLAPSPKKDAELRDTQLSVVLSDGTIFSQAVNEDPKGKTPERAHIMPVTGGTGGYASARGTLNLYEPIFCDSYGIGFDIFVEKDLRTSTLSFDSIVNATATGDAPQGVGDARLTRAVGGANSYISVATRAGSSGGTVLDTVDLQVFTADGSLYARAIARSKGGAAKNQAFAVLGGTGTYSGYRGELTLDASGRSIRLRLAEPTGNAKPITWFEDTGKGVTDLAITGGSFAGVEGLMYEKADRKKKIGDYFATRIVYDEIDGVVPVVTMLEQDFKTGTMIVGGITLSTGEPGTLVAPIIGGTGDYGGASGQVTSAQESTDLSRKTGRFWR